MRETDPLIMKITSKQLSLAAQIVKQGISLPPRAIAVVGRDEFRSTGWERNVSVAVMRDRVEPVGQISRYHNQTGRADWPIGQKKNRRN